MSTNSGRDDEPFTWSVSQVGEWVGLTLAGAFPEEIWVEGEICNLSRSGRGHVYFTLVEPGEDHRHPDHALPVVLFDWYRTRVNQQLRSAGGAIRMEDGVRVRIRGRVDLYAARAQVQLRMVAIDPAFTLGDLAARRERVLRALAADGLLEAQGRLPLPLLPLRLGLVTSLHSAARADFEDELAASGIGFELVVADARVQGAEAEDSVVAALAALVVRHLDLIAIVRGGGARTDLAAFDSEAIARAIAGHPVPVWTGIGHEVDRTIADEVAHRSHKTPTACAAALVTHVRDTSRALDEAFAQIGRRSLEGIARHTALLDQRAGRVAMAGRSRTEDARMRLDHDRRRLRSSVTTRLARDEGRLDEHAARVAELAPRALARADRRTRGVEDRLRAYDPRRAMARGWSLTRRTDGTLVRSPTDVGAGERLVTSTAGGDVISTVVDRRPRTDEGSP